MSEQPAPPSTARVLTATAIALGVACVILVTAILPAEYGIDPLGTGRALGLTRLASPPAQTSQAPGAPSTPPAGFSQDTREVELRPFESFEYKYRLERGGSLVYSWTTGAPVNYDFHGEPDGGAKGNAESYKKGTASNDQGSFTAVKPGIHGWFWENTGPTRVIVTLRTAGFYSSSIELRDGQQITREFPAPAAKR